MLDSCIEQGQPPNDNRRDENTPGSTFENTPGSHVDGATPSSLPKAGNRGGSTSTSLSTTFLELRKERQGNESLISPNVSPLSNVSLNTVAGTYPAVRENTDRQEIDCLDYHTRGTPVHKNTHVPLSEFSRKVTDGNEEADHSCQSPYSISTGRIGSLISTLTTAATGSQDEGSAPSDYTREKGLCFSQQKSLSNKDGTTKSEDTLTESKRNVKGANCRTPERGLGSTSTQQITDDTDLGKIGVELSPASLKHSRPGDASPLFSAWVNSLLRRQPQSQPRRNHYLETQDDQTQPTDEQQTHKITANLEATSTDRQSNTARKSTRVLLTTIRSESNVSKTEQPLSHPTRGDSFDNVRGTVHTKCDMLQEEDFCREIQQQQQGKRPLTPMPPESFVTSLQTYCSQSEAGPGNNNSRSQKNNKTSENGECQVETE